jgi:hypothetical protein
MSLSQIDSLLEQFDDWRVLVASPGTTLGRARLPAKCFWAGDVRERIAQRISEFVDDERRFVIDVGRQRIDTPAVFWDIRRRIIDEYNTTYQTRRANLTTALLPHVTGSAHRRLQDAIGYRCVPAGRSLLAVLLEEK